MLQGPVEQERFDETRARPCQSGSCSTWQYGKPGYSLPRNRAVYPALGTRADVTKELPCWVSRSTEARVGAQGDLGHVCGTEGGGVVLPDPGDRPQGCGNATAGWGLAVGGSKEERPAGAPGPRRISRGGLRAVVDRGIASPERSPPTSTAPERAAPAGNGIKWRWQIVRFSSPAHTSFAWNGLQLPEIPPGRT